MTNTKANHRNVATIRTELLAAREARLVGAAADLAGEMVYAAADLLADVTQIRGMDPVAAYRQALDLTGSNFPVEVTRHLADVCNRILGATNTETTTADTFNLAEDETVELGLSAELDERLYNAMDGEQRHAIRAEIEAGIGLRAHAVDPHTGARIVQSRADVVAAVLNRYSA